MKLFLLLLRKFTYIYIPKKWVAPIEKFPNALCLLPLLGLLAGGLLYAGTWAVSFMPCSGGAAILLGVDLLLGGARSMRCLMWVADGALDATLLSPEEKGEKQKKQPAENPDNARELQEKSWRFNVGRAGLVWGGIWALALYFIYYLFLLSEDVSNFGLLLAPVVNCWLLDWMVWHYPAMPPAWLHKGFSRRNFVICSLLALIPLCLFSSIGLLVSIVLAFLGTALFGTYRRRTVGALDEVCYGAAPAWSRIIFLLAWFAAEWII